MSQRVELLKDVRRVEQARVERVGRLVLGAQHEDLSRLRARRGRLDSLHVLEELLEDPQEGIVVLRAVHLRAEGAALAEVVRARLERGEGQLVLMVAVGVVGMVGMVGVVGMVGMVGMAAAAAAAAAVVVVAPWASPPTRPPLPAAPLPSLTCT